MERHRNANGTYDGVGVMSDVTGLPRDEVMGLWEQVKANHAMLDGCPRHAFSPVLPDRRQERCIHCGGEVGAGTANWYRRGLAHASVPE